MSLRKEMKRSSETGCQEALKRQKLRRIVTLCDIYSGRFKIDESDLLILNEILNEINPIGDEFRIVDATSVHTEERRVLKCVLFSSQFRVTSLPASIGRLDDLACLELFKQDVTSIPASIGKLNNLTRLTLTTSLIASFPVSIGNLRKLEELSFIRCHNLMEIPEEIGELVNLKTLYLQCKKLAFLPSSIGRLQNLNTLDLPGTWNLTTLPDEVSDLVGLTVLDLQDSGIASLPSSIGKLQNLKVLCLALTENLLGLPQEIGNLENLNELCLRRSGVVSLPDSIGSLTGLTYLDVHGSSLPELRVDPNGFLLTLARRCQSLGFLGYRLEEGRAELRFRLACNRAMGRLRSSGMIFETPKMWPPLLALATQAFDAAYVPPRYDAYQSQKPDALYQILEFCRESFVGLLINQRRTKAN